MKKLLTLLALCLPLMAHGEVRELEWDDLRPVEERGTELAPINPHEALPFDDGPMGGVADSMGGDMAPWIQPEGRVVDELNGEQVRLPGFIVPLEGDEERVTEFLLVPYFGACIHVPPPPTNQLVYVKYEEGIPLDVIWDAVWVTGTLKTERTRVDDFAAGYSMEASLANPYDEG